MKTATIRRHCFCLADLRFWDSEYALPLTSSTAEEPKSAYDALDTNGEHIPVATPDSNSVEDPRETFQVPGDGCGSESTHTITGEYVVTPASTANGDGDDDSGKMVPREGEPDGRKEKKKKKKKKKKNVNNRTNKGKKKRRKIEEAARLAKEKMEKGQADAVGKGKGDPAAESTPRRERPKAGKGNKMQMKEEGAAKPATMAAADPDMETSTTTTKKLKKKHQLCRLKNRARKNKSLRDRKRLQELMRMAEAVIQGRRPAVQDGGVENGGGVKPVSRRVEDLAGNGSDKVTSVDGSLPHQTIATPVHDQPRKPYQHRRLDGRFGCHFESRCCVHWVGKGGAASARRSCCCAHFADDCCFCVSSFLDEYQRPRVQEVKIDLPAYPMKDEASGFRATREQASGDTNGADEYHTQSVQNGGSKVEKLPQAKDQHARPDALADAAEVGTDIGTPGKNSQSASDSEVCPNVHLVLQSAIGSFMGIATDADSSLLARSPTISAILEDQSEQGNPIEIKVVTGVKFNLSAAFAMTVDNIYGRPAMDRNGLRRATVLALGYTEDNIHNCPFPLSVAMADFALCSIASAAFFDVSEIVDNNVELAMGLIDWDNVELVLDFGLRVDDFILSAELPDVDSSASTEIVEDDETPMTLEDAHDSTAELKVVWAPCMVTCALNFIASSMTNGFTFYPEAQANVMLDRIPSSLRLPKHAWTDPKLEKIEFGSFPSIEQQKPSAESLLSSAILVSLPFEQLNEAVAELSKREVLKEGSLQEIIDERERRRRYAAKAWKQRFDKEHYVSSEMYELGYKEFVTHLDDLDIPEKGSGSGLSVGREWEGLGLEEFSMVSDWSSAA